MSIQRQPVSNNNNNNPLRSADMQSSQFFISSLKSFAMVSSAKQLATAALFASTLFLCPSLHAGTVYSNTTGSTVRDIGSNTGNTFTTTSSDSTLQSISL